MITKTIPILFMMLVSTFAQAIDTVKTSDTFSDEDLPSVLKDLQDYCDYLQASKIHSAYLVPKLQGSFVTNDPISNAPSAKIESGQCGYFVEGDAAKFIEGLKKPSAVTLIERSTSHIIIPLAESGATTETLVIGCMFVGNNRFIVRKQIAKFANTKADFVYDGDFAVWVKKHMLTATP
ncbi:hypothetical protein [Verrucomicrobium sp. BvORR106]|uniref:hypothetical protein n=1 Tax=Verrucomicrobium sp. BvORR106 TaxID=1403819 RepID=UPI00056DD9B1|nr:hypothetical protein [Verrucomicrobium sp. BvORR106]